MISRHAGRKIGMKTYKLFMECFKGPKNSRKVSFPKPKKPKKPK